MHSPNGSESKARACLCAREAGEERRGVGSGSKETVDLECHHRSWVESEGPRVLRKVLQHVPRVEEPHL